MVSVRFLAMATAVGVAAPSAANAQSEPWRIEVSRGPVVGPASVVGMAGARASLPEGAASIDLNPVAVATRGRHNSRAYFEWDWSFDGILTLTRNNDLENNRRPADPDTDGALLYAAINFMWGHCGIGLSVSTQSFEVGGGTMPVTDFDAGTVALSTGYNLFDGQLSLGGQLIIAVGNMTQAGAVLMDTAGQAGFALGALYQPKDRPFRFGISYRSELSLSPSDAVPGTPVGTTVVPDEIVFPGQLVFGGSYSFGSRARNTTATFGLRGKDPKDHPIPEGRDYLTFAVDGVLTAASGNSLGFEAWTAGERQRIANSPTLGIRVGAESEFWPDQMRGRLGFYSEPSRFEQGEFRLHGTAGFDFRLIELIWVWRFSAAIDLAPRYSNLLLSVGFWH